LNNSINGYTHLAFNSVSFGGIGSIVGGGWNNSITALES